MDRKPRDTAEGKNFRGRGERIVIIGPGRMGLGIALAFALRGFEVAVVDVKERGDGEYVRMVEKAKKELHSNCVLLRKVDDSALDPGCVTSRVSFYQGITAEHLKGISIFEALPEKPDLKIRLFRDISPFIDKKRVVASTTSTIDIGTLGKGLVNPERLLITHWLNPAFIIPLVEIAYSPATNPPSVKRMKRLLKGIGKVPVVLKDSPGFIIPRIQAGAMNEAVRILEEGIATAKEIDTAIRYGFGFRLSAFGLLEFIDMGGLDILYYADDFLYKTYKSDRFRAPSLIREKMKNGETGPRAGRGIYGYEKRNIRTLFEKRYRTLIEVLRAMTGGTMGGR